jgi:hypothetical protein
MSQANILLETRKTDLPVIKQWIDDRDYQAAGNALGAFLTENPDDIDAWFLMGRLMLEEDSPALARIIYEWVIATGGGEQWQNWLNLGKAWDHLLLQDKAEQCYKRALELDVDNQTALVSLGTNYVQQYESDKAIETLERALELYPTAQMAKSSLGFAYLQKREWGKGWDCYESGYGKLRWRFERNYQGEPRWNGARSKDTHLVVHGEQGIGDQIAGLEPLNDVKEDVTIAAVEVSPKIRNLVARSFPDLIVHDSLHKKKIDWHDVPKIDAHAGFFSMHTHYRRQESDYAGKPYLIADPDRRYQWRALLDKLGPEPKIGLAWSGGSALTGRSSRRADLTQWLSILKQNCHWVNLEYKDRSEDVKALQRRRAIEIHDWPWATRTDDYDDTAALVAELDLIICVPTSVVHLAGALGTQVWCMVHSSPNVHYCATGDRVAYYGDRVRLYRRESDDEWIKTANKIAKDLETWISNRFESSSDTTPQKTALTA